MSTTTVTPPAVEPGTLAHVDPGTLLLERNIRDATPDPELVESIRAHGVLEPITAVTSPAGLVVRFGHRRTLAAVKADRDTVPVYVVGPDDVSKEAEVRRVLSQYDENTQRKDLTTADEVGVVEQLVAFGLTAAEISKQARVHRDGVDLALQVTKSSVARKAAAEWDALTLDQAAVLAEFEDDPEVVEALITKAVEAPGSFVHAAQRARDDRARAVAVRNATEELVATGVTLIERPPYDGKIKNLEHLLTSAGKTLTPKAHRTCQGHVAWLNGTTPTYGCTNWKANGHKERWPSGTLGSGKTAAADMSEAEREQAKKARKLVIENNRAWDSAQVVRREWLAELAQRKAAPKGAAAFISFVIGVEPRFLNDYEGKGLAAEWLGVPAGSYGSSGAADAAAKATEGRALLIALVQVLAGVETVRDRQDWRQNGKTSSAGHYLRYLESIGYTLSDVEKYAVSTKTGN